jgi:hypothetical protein
MNRRMFKPTDLTTRQTAAAINRLNNALPLFPLGTEALKVSDSEIIGLLEWSLPPQWRTKFDLDGCIHSLHPRFKLIEGNSFLGHPFEKENTFATRILVLEPTYKCRP